MESTTSSSLEKITKKQQDYAEIFNIPTIPVVPTITKFRPIGSFSSDHDIWHVQERFLFYEYGMVFWEISFNTKLTQNHDFELEGFLKIENHSLISNAIHYKKRSCKTHLNEGYLCQQCKLISTNLVSTIISFYSKGELYSHFHTLIGDVDSFKRENRDFLYGESIWRIQEDKQLILMENLSKRARNTILDKMLWTSALAMGIYRSGNEILEFALKRLPPHSLVVGNELKRLQKDYLRKFLFRFLYTDPDFLTSKTDIRLHIESRQLKPLIYSFECLVPRDFWDVSNDRIQKFVPQSIVPFMLLYANIRSLTHGKFNDWSKYINPNYFHTIPSDPYYVKKISEVEQKICYLMAKQLVNTSTTGKDSLASQSDFEPLSMNQIHSLRGLTRGSQSRKTKKVVNALVDKEILSEIEATGDLKRGRAKFLYYLNPKHPYTEYFIQLNLSDNKLEPIAWPE